MKFAFDFFGTLFPSREQEWDRCEQLCKLTRVLARVGEIHIVSAVSPGLPMDRDEAYAELLQKLDVPFTKIWRVDHKPELKVAALKQLRVGEMLPGIPAFWDDVEANVAAARAEGFSTCWVGHDPFNVTTRQVGPTGADREHLYWPKE